MLTLQQVPTPCAAKGSLLNCQTCLYHRRRVWGWQSQFRDGRNSLQRNTAVTTPRYQHNTNEMPQRLPTFKTVATGTGSLICSPEHEHNATFAAQTTARRADNASSVMTMRIGGQAGLHTSKSCVSGAFRTPVCGAVRSSTRSRMPLLVQAAGKTRVVRGKCYVTRDNIDTDQIIPAEYLTLVPSKKDEYEKLGSYALIGLPTELYPTRFIKDGEMKAEYPVVIGGENFGCGSSREHAPVCMGAAGAKMVVSQSYARIFFRNCVSTGEVYPVETDVRLCDVLETGQEVEVDLEKDVLTDIASGKQYPLKSIGEAGPVVDAGGIFEYARQTGMIKQAATA